MYPHPDFVTMILGLTLLIGSLVFLIWNFRSQSNGAELSRTGYLNSAEACRQMLRQESFESRAKANEQLRQVFKIENAFTTTDLTYKQQFVDEAKRLLQTNDDGWQTFANTAQAAFDATLDSSPDREFYRTEIRLVHLVRTVVFTAGVKKFFPSNPDLTLHVGSVWRVTQLINDLWIQSKSQNIAPEPLSNQEELQTELKHMNFDTNTTTDPCPRSNPMNLILPAYEALWSVVLRLTIEILYRNHPQRTSWVQTLTTFIHTPTPATFKSPSPATGITVQALVNEALRLYTPTRRIYRQHPTGPGWKIAADVEAVHRDPEVWGADATLFRPERWLDPEAKKRQNEAFMPFGYGPLACPTRHGKGQLMIGILVGVLVKNLGEKNIGVEAVDGRSRIEGVGPLEGGRESYGGLVLQVPKADELGS